MRVVNLSPSILSAISNAAPNGAYTIVGALRDDSDASYVDFSPAAANMEAACDDLSLADGEQIYEVEGFIRLRVLTDGGKSWVQLRMVISTVVFEFWSTPSGISDTTTRNITGPTVFFGPGTRAFTEAELTAAHLQIHTQNVAAPSTVVRVYGALLKVTITARPAVAITGPSGVVTNTQPTITWTFDGDALPQRYFWARVFTAAVAAGVGFDPETSPAVWASGVVANAASAKQIGVALADGNYVAYVKAAQGRGQWSLWDSSAFTVAHGPNTPTIVSPNSGTVLDASAGIVLDWAYSHPTNVPQAFWAIRRSVDGGVIQYWRTSDNTWQPAIVYNAGNVTQEAFPAGAFPLGHTYTWAVAVADSNSLTSPWSADSIFTSTGPPTVNITAPAGTVTTTTRPTVTWTFTDGAGRPEDTFRVKVFPLTVTQAGGFDPETSSGAVVDSGTRAGPDTAFVTTYDFPPDNTQHVAYVKVSAGGQSSGWDSQQFGVNVAAPAAPTGITAVENVAVNGVDVTVTGSAGGGFSGVTTVVERSLDNGSTWETVRFSTSPVTDYEVPARTAVKYRAKFRGTSGAGTIAGTYSIIATVTTHPVAWWLRDVHDPTLRYAIATNEGLKVDHPLGVGMFDTVGADDAATTISEPTPRGAEFVLELWVKVAADKAAIDAILRPGRSLLVQDVLNQQWFVSLTDQGVSWEFLRSPSGSMPREHAYKYSVPMKVVERPAVT